MILKFTLTLGYVKFILCLAKPPALKSCGTFVYFIIILTHLHILFSYFGFSLPKTYCINSIFKNVSNDNKQVMKASAEFYAVIYFSQTCSSF